MASTNVDYYQKQKDLLDSMHENESRRRNLEAQLQAYFQSDHKMEKLRAVKLQSYWKKICEDEKRSKQRNSQLMRDLDRIEANMAGLEARREKIRHMKEQYFDYIEQTYPQWLELVNRKKQEDQQKNRPTTNQQQMFQQQQQQQTYQQQQQQQQYQQQEYQQQQQQQPTYEQQKHMQYQQEQQQQKYQQHQAQQQRQQQQNALQVQQQRDEEEIQQKEYKSQQTHKKQQEYLFEKQQQNENVMPEENGEGEGFIYDIPPPLPSQPPPPMSFSGDSEFQDREYTNLKNVRRQQQATAPSQIVTVHVPSVDRDEAGSPAKLRPDSGHRDPSNQKWVPADRDTSIQSLSVSDMDPEPPFSQQPIQSVTVRQKSDPPKFMEPQSDEDVSDFGDDVDLPSGEGPVHSANKQEVHVALVHGEDDGHREDSPIQKTDENTEEEEMGPAIVHPELSTHGLFSLLRYVEDEIGNALSVEGYYRCRNPDPSTRKDIIHKANNNLSLTTTDGEFVSMVILEQLTPVVRRLPGACMLSDTLLVRNADSLNESLIRNNLHRDALQIWEKLLDHFMCLVKYHVMGTRELATVFVPCLVHQSSQHKDKTVSILETIVESAFEKKEGMTSPARQDSLDTARSSQQEGVPPLKFGSLVESKAFTDEESSMITQSMNTEGSKLPLNETEAYKNLLSGSLPMSRPQVQADDTDENSDNELEKQYMSTFTPRSHASKRLSEPPNDKPSSVPPPLPHHDESTDQSADQEPDSEIGYVPTAPEPSTIKSVLGSTGGSSQQRRLADKLGMNSDLDTDTELDIENMVTKKEEDDDDFYDFYG